MGYLPVLMALVAAGLLYGTDHPFLVVLAVCTAVGCLWSWGVMHNFGTETARGRSSYRGGFYDISPSEADAVPNWIAIVNMGASALALLLLIVAVFIRSVF